MIAKWGQKHFNSVCVYFTYNTEHTQYCPRIIPCWFIFNIQTRLFHMSCFCQIMCVCVCVCTVCSVHGFTVHAVPVLSCMLGSLTYCVCACRPQSHIISNSIPADLWGQRAVVGRARSHDCPPANLAQTPHPLGLFCKAPLPLPLSGWKWADGWGATVCDPQLNSLMCSYSTHITPVCSCDMATLCCCSRNTVNLNMEPHV